MNDAELLALAAIVNQETVIMQSLNADRLRDNYALAYQDQSENYYILEKELQRRKIL